jgi:hypothetical protein
MKNKTILSVLTLIAATAVVQPAFAEAIWTTVSDGSEVNFNIYDNKGDVYLNGGPGKGAGTNAKGLDDGTYVFMVTDPSGKTLLSTDAAICRQVTVTNGIFAEVPVVGCQHVVGSTQVGITVQLLPFDDTPNRGGEYKAWLTPLANYTCDLNVIDCSLDTHGFVNRYSKTDNFKVGPRTPHEIDTRFFKDGAILDGPGIVWSDTLGASNKKYSYYAPEISVNHEAHVEAPEAGFHQIFIANQSGCEVSTVSVDGVQTKKNGTQTIPVHVTQALINKATTIFVDVQCK